ncbi:MAG: protein-L-isoaspartate(D-aspartate) O-methyltransferase [Pseudomonadota bacterium]
MAGLIGDPQSSARLVLTLRRQGVTDDAVLSAIERVDRAAFVAEPLKDIAHDNTTLPIPCGQSIPRPLVTARLLHALNVQPGAAQRVFLVGAGSGYTACLLGEIAHHVFAVERYRVLAEAAHQRLAAMGMNNVSVFHGDGLDGLEAQAPFDRILLAGSVKTIPAKLIQQLTPEGQLTGVVMGAKGQLMLRSYSGHKILREADFDDALGVLVKGVSHAL